MLTTVAKIDVLERNAKGFDEYMGTNSKRLDTAEHTLKRFDEVD